MRKLLQSFYLSAVNSDGETGHILALLKSLDLGPDSRVLDVGCGYGRLLALMRASGLDATGVEVNAEIVATNLGKGLPCVTPQQFTSSGGQYDVIVMAHIIEHFSPADLLPFMDDYLDHLKPGGRLIVATPLMSDYFYDDFDHIKPYQPNGIVMVFGQHSAQVQYYARNRLVLRDLWFRRSPLRISYSRWRYFRSPWRYSLFALDFAAVFIFFLSGKLIGKTNGWVGVFEKPGKSDS
ncbi:MAG: class I SAM-dependent methyltransferase [Betaproteobacteria bacterium]